MWILSFYFRTNKINRFHGQNTETSDSKIFHYHISLSLIRMWMVHSLLLLPRNQYYHPLHLCQHPQKFVCEFWNYFVIIFSFSYPMVNVDDNRITEDSLHFSSVSATHSCNAVPAFGRWRKIWNSQGPLYSPCNCSPRLFSRWKPAMRSISP